MTRHAIKVTRDHGVIVQPSTTVGAPVRLTVTTAVMGGRACCELVKIGATVDLTSDQCSALLFALEQTLETAAAQPLAA